MALALVGTVPVSALNIGLVAGIPVIQAQITKLGADILALIPNILGQIELALNVPTPTFLAPALAASLLDLPFALNPLNWVSSGVEASIDIGIELGLISAQLGAATLVSDLFSAGLGAGSLAAWSYAGRASGFGEQMGLMKQWGGVAASESVNGLVIATESFSSWGSFSASFNSGTTSTRRATTEQAILTFLGVLAAGSLNTGVLGLKKQLDLFLGSLQGLEANLEGQLEVSFGLDLPDLESLVSAALSLPSVDVLFDNILTANVDLAGEIGAIQAQIDGLLSAVLELNAQLSAGGLSFWTYSGTAGDFGPSVKAALAGGLPGGSGPRTPAYGVAVATQLPSAWTAFGGIFAVAA